MTKKQEEKFRRKLARRSNKRVPGMLTMTFAELAALNESYAARCQAERDEQAN